MKSLREVREFLLKDLIEGDKTHPVKVEGFVNSYEEDILLGLNNNQLDLLFFMFYQHSSDTDHASFGIAKSRRSTINTANSLNRRGLLWWDTSNYYEDGYTLTLSWDKLKTEDYLGK